MEYCSIVLPILPIAIGAPGVHYLHYRKFPFLQEKPYYSSIVCSDTRRHIAGHTSPKIALQSHGEAMPVPAKILRTRRHDAAGLPAARSGIDRRDFRRAFRSVSQPSRFRGLQRLLGREDLFFFLEGQKWRDTKRLLSSISSSSKIKSRNVPTDGWNALWTLSRFYRYYQRIKVT